MKLLTAVLVLLISTNYVIGADGSSNSAVTTVAPVDTTPAAATSPAASPETSAATVPGSTVPAGTGSTIPAGTGSTAPPGTGSTAPAGTGSTVTDSGNTGTPTGVPTTTPKPLELSTFPVSNDVNVLDAKLILQQAVQLDQQINAFNDYLIKAQNDTDPAKSPLFDQLNAFSDNIRNQNKTLQGYISQLQRLSESQFALDQRVSSAASTFVCFSQSSCVTDVPTTPEPTSPGPTQPVIPCNNTNLKTDSDVSKTKSYPFPSKPNVALCSIKVLASNQANNVSVTINATFTGPDAYVKLNETRTLQSATINGSITNYVFQGFQEVDVYYFSGPRSTVQFNFTYQEVNNCLLNCTGSNGECKVSQSGVQYCECKKCQFTGDFCEVTLAYPCQSKQMRVCGGNNKTDPYGICYKNICSDSCYSCGCSPEAEVDGTDQKCRQPSSPGWTAPVAPTAPTVCPTTAAPSTTTALLTSTAAPIGSSSAAPGSSVAPVSTVTSDSSATTVSGGPSPSSSAIPIVSSSVAASSSSTAPSDAPSTASSSSTS